MPLLGDPRRRARRRSRRGCLRGRFPTATDGRAAGAGHERRAGGEQLGAWRDRPDLREHPRGRRRDHGRLDTDRSAERQQRGLGSGFVDRLEGHIVTNDHVVDGASSISVRVLERRHLQGDARRHRRIHRSRRDQGRRAGLRAPPARARDSERSPGRRRGLRARQPFGLDETVTSGIVSALHRQIRRSTASRSTTRSRRTPRSTTATPAARS